MNKAIVLTLAVMAGMIITAVGNLLFQANMAYTSYAQNLTLASLCGLTSSLIIWMGADAFFIVKKPPIKRQRLGRVDNSNWLSDTVTELRPSHQRESNKCQHYLVKQNNSIPLDNPVFVVLLGVVVISVLVAAVGIAIPNLWIVSLQILLGIAGSLGIGCAILWLTDKLKERGGQNRSPFVHPRWGIGVTVSFNMEIRPRQPMMAAI